MQRKRARERESEMHLAHLSEEAEEAECPQDAELLDPRVAAAARFRILKNI